MEFVTYEIGKKLQEKGYTHGYNCFGYRPIYSDEYTIKYLIDVGAYERGYYGENIPCPTISQVFKWMREKNNIHITVGQSGETKWCYVIVYLNEAYFDNSNIIKSKFDTYEQAALAGIEYVLDNLIQKIWFLK